MNDTFDEIAIKIELNDMPFAFQMAKMPSGNSLAALCSILFAPNIIDTREQTSKMKLNPCGYFHQLRQVETMRIKSQVDVKSSWDT